MWAVISKLVTLDGQIIAIVNNDASAEIDPVYMYDSTNQTWKSISADLNDYRGIYIKDIIVFHHKLYTCGGDASDASTVLYVYDNSKAQWKLVNNGLPNFPSLVSSSAHLSTREEFIN